MSLDLPDLPGVTWSMRARDLATGELLAERNPDTVLRTASVGKIFLLLEVARQLDAGTLDPALRLAYTDEDLVADSGLWYRLDQRDLTVTDLCRLVGAVSDNLATNVLLRHVGLDAVTRLTASLGVSRSALLDRVRDERTPDLPPTLSRGCAGEWCDLMVRLSHGELVSAPVSRMVTDWLSGNADQSMVGGGFAPDPLAHAEWDRDRWLANKTGTISTVRADVGFVVTGAGSPPPSTRATGVAWAVLAGWDDDADPRESVLAAMHNFGEALASRV